MAILTANQLTFLKDQDISLGDVFDATGLKRKDYQELMREAGVHFAYGTNPCSAGGHTIRSRAGHCIQCHTSAIAYSKRHSSEAHVYISTSQDKGLTKVGLSIDLTDRLYKLNDYRYGGARDWRIERSLYTQNAGRVEFATHERLAASRTEGSYIRAGRVQTCYELFRCDLARAEAALRASAPSGAWIRTH